jgi:polyisoprenyl-teichoic acid--peptidoglycan teichoic acid transferase
MVASLDMLDTTSRGLRTQANQVRARRKRRRLGLVGLVLVLVVAGSTVGYARWRLGQIASVDVPGLHATKPGRPFNVLVVGSDSRANTGGRYGDVAGQRNDVTMVVHVDPGLRTVSLLSIPRDLLVPIADTGRQDKINAAFSGGPSRVAKTIEQNFGIPINHYLLIDFNGFKSIVDALGGIRINFPYPSRDMDNQGHNLSGLDVRRAGCQRLNGTQALALARSRDFSYLKDGRWRWDPNGDLGRVRRQQAFLQGVLSKGLSQGLTNPLKANSFIGAVVGDLTKDKGLKISEIVSTAARFRSFSPSAMATFTVPTQALWVGKSYHGELLKQVEAEKVIAKFLGRPDPTAAAQRADAAVTVSTLIHVRNAVGVQGLAQRARDQLVRAGFRVADVGNASVGGLAVTRILYHPGESARAAALRSWIVGPSQVEQSSAVAAGELTLLLGSSFGGVQRGASPSAAPTTTAATSSAPYGTSGAQAGGKKPAAKKQALDLRDYDPRPC